MPNRVSLMIFFLGLVGLLWACSPTMNETTKPDDPIDSTEATAHTERPDVHSFSRPDEVSTHHLTLDLEVDFAAKELRGTAELQLERHDPSAPLRLDTRDLTIRSVTLDDGTAVEFTLGEDQPFLGRELIIPLGEGTSSVRVEYTTDPKAAALQWLEPNQTAGDQPFLFTQSQAILARTWIPCQDTPAVRITYDATVRVPPGAMAVMSAENGIEKNPDGVYTFKMPQAIPAYLLALAVGDLAFQSIGERTGVYAEPSVVEAAAWEFADTEDMMIATEAIYGPYRWGRYDILVLPPSFPFGGMENPRLTFATPTILAGDRSLVALIAHELAHSWSGNLVTNATWDDFWLNEGFTVYLERRIMEAISGQDYADMLARLGQQDLYAQVEDLGATSTDTHLHLDLEGRDPDDGMTDIAYEKGYFFLLRLENLIGRESFDAFLADYFERNAFQSLTTAQFVEQLRAAFPDRDDLGIDSWIYGAGAPNDMPQIASAAFDRVDAQLAAWSGGTAAANLATDGWTTHEWLHFLRGLPAELNADTMAELDAAFGFTKSGNSEILNAWFGHAIAQSYETAYPALETFLTDMGRRKFLRPLYQALVDHDQLELAQQIYATARPGYHSVSSATIDSIVGTP